MSTRPCPDGDRRGDSAHELPGFRLTPLTSSDRARRGAELSYRVRGAPELRTALADRGVDVDLRDPDVLRSAPAPLFNPFDEVWRAARYVREWLETRDS